MAVSLNNNTLTQAIYECYNGTNLSYAIAVLDKEDAQEMFKVLSTLLRSLRIPHLANQKQQTFVFESGSRLKVVYFYNTRPRIIGIYDKILYDRAVDKKLWTHRETRR